MDPISRLGTSRRVYAPTSGRRLLSVWGRRPDTDAVPPRSRADVSGAEVRNADAFAKPPAGTLDTLLTDPKGALTTILTYHVIPGKVMAADVVKMDGAKVKTVNGAELTIKVSGSDVMLMDATDASVKVVKTDVTASNGVIHVIDGVLLPSK